MNLSWTERLLLGTLALMCLSVFMIVAFIVWLSIECYQSGNKDSMACYMTRGRSIEATIRQ